MPGENYILLERTELNAAASSVTFSNIPQSGYTDLKIVGSVRGTASSVQNITISFNGSTANFTRRSIFGDGSTASSTSGSNSNLSIIQGTNYTASTFSNIEMYIPNYTSSSNKSFSIDSVTENNATTSYTVMDAGLWSNSAAITSVGFTPTSGSFDANSTFSLYGIAALGTTPVIAPKAIGGNRIDNDGTYWYHTFTSSGSFTPIQGISCDVLVVAGGGGGGYDAAGGGGAGGIIYQAGMATSNSQTIVIGAGGAGATSTSSTVGGSNSTAFTMTAFGGGIGGPGGSGTGQTGGSGGGGGWGRNGAAATQTSNNGGTGYGNAGGNGGTNNYPGAGGGGAGAAGANCTTNAATAGGIGLNTWSSWASATNTGDSGYYAGGGGGGAVDASRALGGLGGGGAGSQGGSQVAEIAGSNATANTGGGGGGGGANISPAQQSGYNGGSGIVIIRYTIA